MALLEVKVPNLGDFKDVPVIEILVKPGDAVMKEASLVTLESDKSTMDVPSPAAGVVKEIKLKVGDKVSAGAVVLMLESGGAPAAAPAPAKAAAAPAPAAPQAAAKTAPPPTAAKPTPVAAPVTAAAVDEAGFGKSHASP